MTAGAGEGAGGGESAVIEQITPEFGLGEAKGIVDWNSGDWERRRHRYGGVRAQGDFTRRAKADRSQSGHGQRSHGATSLQRTPAHVVWPVCYRQRCLPASPPDEVSAETRSWVAVQSGSPAAAAASVLAGSEAQVLTATINSAAWSALIIESFW